jgi:acetyl esterase/lipase
VESELVRPLRRSYGREAFQYGDIYLAPDPRWRRPIVILHGGFWRPHRGLEMTAPVAEDLARQGWNTWNVEYRRNAQGEWPATLDDCDAAIDHLAPLGVEFEFDPAKALVIGHSAGGHLAVWLAGRGVAASRRGRRAPVVRVADVISLAGVLNFDVAARTGVGEGAVPEFVGGDPERLLDRYREADPMRRLPTASRVRCLHSRDDERVPFDQSVSYVDAARRCGDDAELIEVPGTHGDVIDIASAAWPIVVGVIESLEE